ncbi:phasin family protein [Pleionea sp. CnH1-48]|uniref:phasin family protein n=1 Tax=Pleionea sp. CnH1-48 TaxID=2954494 RepID=UPI002096DF20|nr:phasin family protein [Pleionea sp. CnH1-48]MCO7225715.1 phasin family protein [Pleionea sp. CnH1-48]
MFAQFMNQFAEQSKVFVEPAFEMNRIALEQMQKIGQKNLELANEYAKVGFEQMTKLSKVKSPEELQSLAQEQLSVAADLSRKVADDAKGVLVMGQELGDEWKKFVEVSSEKSFSAVAPAKPAAKK